MNRNKLKVVLEKTSVYVMTIGIIVFLIGIILLAAGWFMDYWDLLYEGRNFILAASVCFFSSVVVSVVNECIAERKDE